MIESDSPLPYLAVTGSDGASSFVSLSETGSDLKWMQNSESDTGADLGQLTLSAPVKFDFELHRESSFSLPQQGFEFDPHDVSSFLPLWENDRKYDLLITCMSVKASAWGTPASNFMPRVTSSSASVTGSDLMCTLISLSLIGWTCVSLSLIGWTCIWLSFIGWGGLVSTAMSEELVGGAWLPVTHVTSMKH